MSSAINSTNSSISQMNIQSVQQNRDKMFGKVNNNTDGETSQTGLDAVIVQLSGMSGNALNIQDIFQTYDASGSQSGSASQFGGGMQQGISGSPRGMRPPPPPSLEETFSNTDTNSDDGISQSEFSDFATEMTEKTGTSIDVEDVFSTYDTDEDGILSQDEMVSFMEENVPPPPPPPPPQSGFQSGGAEPFSSKEQ